MILSSTGSVGLLIGIAHNFGVDEKKVSLLLLFININRLHLRLV